VKNLRENPAGHRDFGASTRWKTAKGLVLKGLDAGGFKRWLWRHGRVLYGLGKLKDFQLNAYNHVFSAYLLYTIDHRSSPSTLSTTRTPFYYSAPREKTCN